MFHREDDPGERLILEDWKPKTVEGVLFDLIDPKGDKVPNAILLHSREGAVAAKMPKSVAVPCDSPAKAIHILGAVAGWAFPFGASQRGSVSMIVRLHYAGGKTEEHELKNGEEIADYVRRAEVPGSTYAMMSQDGKQVRYLKLAPREKLKIEKIELVKGSDGTAPIVLAMTLELPD